MAARKEIIDEMVKEVLANPGMQEEMNAMDGEEAEEERPAAE